MGGGLSSLGDTATSHYKGAGAHREKGAAALVVSANVIEYRVVIACLPRSRSTGHNENVGKWGMLECPRGFDAKLPAGQDDILILRQQVGFKALPVIGTSGHVKDFKRPGKVKQF